MRRTLQLALCLFFFSFIWESYGQTKTNIQTLKDLSVQFNSEYEQNRAEVIEYARINNIPVRFETEDAVFEMQYIDEFGKPQYYKTENKNAAATVSANKVHNGGGAGLNLDGTGMTIHEWDGGGVLTTHQEFGSRVTQVDGPIASNYHSTHVAGTMIASGIDADAKGMSPNANLSAFDWNDDNSEMATEAAAGALISNHSYGFIRGWYTSDGTNWTWYGNTFYSSTEDYLFGFYDENAQAWDEIAYNAPYYLICKSAGNDRGDGPSNAGEVDVPEFDGGTDGYDCVGSQGTAKNILTVGAINDIPNSYEQPGDVEMSSFSGWGPTDDGRIKPDIVANGIDLYSTDNGNNTAYYSMSGTSMATPSAAGALMLLQEHYENLNGTGSFMRSATLKALAIHTADEAGSDLGPDYQNGWGLLNIKRAAAKITEDQTNDVISEHTLSNGGTYTTNITATSGFPIKVTVVWTDPKGIPVTPVLNPTNKMLVNDLDLRITDQSSTTHYPWKLSRTSPANAATRAGENDVDNVEVVLIENPTPGETYTITVDHDGTLASSQAFSMIISGYALDPSANFYASTKICQVNETVYFTDASTENPTSWLWSISPNTYSFVNSTSATSQNPEIEFTDSGVYEVTLYVENAYGNNTEVKANFITASYYCSAYSTHPYGTINRVQLGSIDNSSTYTNVGIADPNDKYYEDFTSLITDFSRNETKSLTVSSNYTNAGLDLGVWIDWNSDGDFDDTDENVVCEEDGGGVGTFNITAPATASLGNTQMRLRTKYWDPDCGSSCGSTLNGEVEDYTINILPAEYCSASGGGSRGYISGVVLNTISNTGTSRDGYHDYTSLSTELNILENYDVTVTNGVSNKPNYDLGIWVDWNQDEDFDDSDEQIVCFISNNGQGTYNFDVPATANLGTTRLRVRIKLIDNDCGSACDTTSYGEVEDYTINVKAGTLTWDGSESTDWDDPNNWDGGVVPTANFHAIIPSSTPYSPTIGTGKSVTCSTCTIQSGATLTINGNLTQNNLEQ